MANGLNENTSVPVKWLAGTVAVCFTIGGLAFFLQTQYYDDRVATSEEIARTIRDALAAEQKERNRDMSTLNQALTAIRSDNERFRADIVKINERLAVDAALLESAGRARYTSLDAARDWVEAERLNTWENLQKYGWRAPKGWPPTQSVTMGNPIKQD